MKVERNKISHNIIEVLPYMNRAFISAPIFNSLDGKHIKTETGIEIKLEGAGTKTGFAKLPMQFTRLSSSNFLFCILERDVKTGKKYVYFSALSERPLKGMTRYEVY